MPVMLFASLNAYMILLQVKEGGYDHKVNETVTVVSQKTSEIGQRTWGIMKGVMAMASQKVDEYTRDNTNWRNDNWQRNENDRNGFYQEFNQENKGWNSSTGGQPSSGGQFNTQRSSSWDDWDQKDTTRKEEPARGYNSSSWDDWDRKDTTRKEQPANGSASRTSGGQSKTYSTSSWDDWDQKETRKEEPSKGSGAHNSDAWAGWDDAKDDGYDHFYEGAANKKAVGRNGKSDAGWDGGFL